MGVLSIVLGVLMVIAGFSCIFTPIMTFLDAGYFIVILIGIYGIAGIFKSVGTKKFGVGFVFSILSAIFALTTLFFPKMMALTDGLMIYLTAAWFVLQGIVTIIASIQLKKAKENKIWIFELIIGILAVILGCYSFFHPMLVALSIGLLIAVYFIETGITMIVAGAAKSK